MIDISCLVTFVAFFSLSLFFRLLVVRFYIYFFRRDTFTAENLRRVMTHEHYVAQFNIRRVVRSRIFVSLTMEPGEMHLSASLFSSMHTNRLISQRYPTRVSLGS